MSIAISGSQFANGMSRAIEHPRSSVATRFGVAMAVGLACSPSRSDVRSQAQPRVNAQEAGASETDAIAPFSEGEWQFRESAALWVENDAATIVSLVREKTPVRVRAPAGRHSIGPTGRFVAIDGGPSETSFWDTQSGTRVDARDERAKVALHVHVVQWSRDGQVALLGSEIARRWYVMDMSSGSVWEEPSWTVTDEAPGDHEVRLLFGGRYLLHVPPAPRSQEIWNVGTRKLLAKVNPDLDTLDSADGRRVAVNHRQRRVAGGYCGIGSNGGGGIWDTSAGRFLWTVPDGELLSASPQFRYVLVGHAAPPKGRFSVRAADTGATMAEGTWTGALCPSWVWRGGDLDGFAYSDDGDLMLWRDSEKGFTRVRANGPESTSEICSSDDGSRLWSGDFMRAWSAPGETLGLAAAVITEDSAGCAFSHHGSHVVRTFRGSFQILDASGQSRGLRKDASAWAPKWLNDFTVGWRAKGGWLCLDRADQPRALCVRAAQRGGKPFLVAVDDRGRQNVSSDPAAFEVLMKSAAAVPIWGAETPKVTYEPDLIAPFFSQRAALP